MHVCMACMKITRLKFSLIPTRSTSINGRANPLISMICVWILNFMGAPADPSHWVCKCLLNPQCIWWRSQRDSHMRMMLSCMCDATREFELNCFVHLNSNCSCFGPRLAPYGFRHHLHDSLLCCARRRRGSQSETSRI